MFFRGLIKHGVLEESVEADQVAAELRQGVLTIRLPKAAASRPRKIEVSRAE